MENRDVETTIHSGFGVGTDNQCKLNGHIDEMFKGTVWAIRALSKYSDCPTDIIKKELKNQVELLMSDETQLS